MKRILKKSVIAIAVSVAVVAASSTASDAGEVRASQKKVKITNVLYGALTIKKGSTYQLKAKAGTSKKVKFVWESSNKKKVSVNKKGKIKGLEQGTATIKVGVKGKNYKKASIKVTVGTKVSQIKVLRPAMVLCVGSTATIKSQVLPSNASNKKKKYHSSNSKIATVNSKGVVKGIRAGNVKITIKAADGSGKKTTVTAKIKKDASQMKLVDDFYQKANEDILRDTDMDLKVGEWSQFSKQEEIIEDRIEQLIEDASKKSNTENFSENNISDLYLTVLDTKTRNEYNLQTIQSYLDEMEQVSNINEYIKLAGKLSNEGVDGIFCPLVYKDLKQNDTYRVYFTEMDTGLTHTEFTDGSYQHEREAYKKYVKKLFTLSGETSKQASENASKVIEFQKNIAASEINLFDSYDTDKIYHKYSAEQLKKVFTNCDLELYLKETGYDMSDTFIVMNPTQINKINKYLKDSNLDFLKEFAKMKILSLYAPYLTTDFAKAYETFDEVRTMQKKQQTAKEKAKDIVENVLSWEVSELYVEKYIAAGTKEDVSGMVEDIISEYRKEIESSAWMSDSTKANAIKKVDSMKKAILYPNDWRGYVAESDLKSPKEGGILSDNMQMLFRESRETWKDWLSGSTFGTEWSDTPLEVNAYYIQAKNSITIPFGIVDGIFYDKNRSSAANLGSIGVIIGHEISHAFDKQGAEYDENGLQKDWWTSEDKKKYNDILKKIEQYYDTFEVLPGEFQDGKATLSENIADLAGANCAVKLVGQNNSARKQFFESYANMWAGEMTDRETLMYLFMDSHSNRKVRVNAVVSMLDEFYETYGVKKTDAMYVAPEDRIKIW